MDRAATENGAAMSGDDIRERERAKYVGEYGNPSYKMCARRCEQAGRLLRGIERRASLLDVSCGRGEVLRMARGMGWREVRGTEIVPDLIGGDVVFAWSDALPFGDGSMETVTCFDVMEHIPAELCEATVRELGRVCAWRLLVTICNQAGPPHPYGPLHITLRPYAAWDAGLRAWLPGYDVRWRTDESGDGTSELWECVKK